MIAVEYKGYRITCISLLPITNNTLIYGSSDGGKINYNSSEEFSEKMEKIAKKLKIAARTKKQSSSCNELIKVRFNFFFIFF